jgi:hypothetical protein
MYHYEQPDPNKVINASGITEDQEKRIKANTQMRLDATLRGYTTLDQAANPEYETDAVSSEVEANLEGATMKFGTGGEWTWDSGIEWKNKKSLAAAIGFGDQVGDVWRGIKSWMQEKGLADDLIDVAAQDENERILRVLYDDAEFGNATLVGGVAGALAEPIGLLMPLGKAKSTGTAILGAAALGGLYGSALYVDENESRLHNAALGAATMGIMSGVAHKFFKQAVGDDVAERVVGATDFEVERATAIVEKQAAKQIALESSPEYITAQAKVEREALEAYPKTEKEWNDAKKIVKKQAKAALKEAGYKKGKKGKKKKEPEDVVEEIETASAFKGKKQGKLAEARKYVDAVLQPLYDNVRKYSAKVAHGLRDADAIQHRRQHVWTKATLPFQKLMRNMSKEDYRQLKRLLSNGGFNKATMTFLQQQGGSEAVRAVAAVEDVLDEIFGMYKKAGYKLGKGRKNYFPLAVKDLDGLRQKEQSALDAVFAREVARQGGRPLTASQKAHISEHYFTFDTRYSTTSGSLQKRMKQGVKDEELDFYPNPADALHYYLHTAAEDIAKREFFKKWGYKPKANGLAASGSDIDDSITSLIDQIKKDVPDWKDQQTLADLLRSRFSADVHKTHKFVQAIKNLSYSGTLGNYWSAMTQIGDLVFAFHKYGIKATVGALLGPKVTSRAELGVEKAMAELQSETMGFTSRLAEFAFKWSGFSKIDQFGKNVNINAALRKNRELAIKDPNKFVAKYEDKFGPEVHELVRELQRMKMTKNNDTLSDNMYLMLWNELADTQPIGLSEMPQKYLEMPNGRIFYAYKTFSIKQLNYMRNMINNDKNPFTKGYNLMMFSSMFVAANGSIDGLKDFMAGKEINWDDKWVDNAVSLVGTSKYAVDKSQGLGGIIMQGLAPVPITQGAKALDSLTGDDSWSEVASGAANQTPILGKLKKEWLDQ